MDLHGFLNKSIGLTSLFFALFAVVGNLFTCYICLRKRLRKINTFLFMSILSLCDLFSLQVWNLDQFLQAYFGFSHEFISVWWCKLSVFTQYYSLQYSAWLLVLITLDRYLSIRIKTWRATIFRTKSALVTALTLGVVLFMVNGHLLYFNGYSTFQNNTERVHCYKSAEMSGVYYRIWQRTHLILYSLVPICLLVLINGMLLCRALRSGPRNLSFSQSMARKERKKTMTFTIVTLTIMFILSTLPYTFVTTFFFTKQYNKPFGKLLINSLSLLSFSYHAFNCIILIISNKPFLNECKSFYKGLTKPKSSTYMSTMAA